MLFLRKNKKINNTKKLRKFVSCCFFFWRKIKRTNEKDKFRILALFICDLNLTFFLAWRVVFKVIFEQRTGQLSLRWLIFFCCGNFELWNKKEEDTLQSEILSLILRRAWNPPSTFFFCRVKKYYFKYYPWWNRLNIDVRWYYSQSSK